ncbi:MAG: hypothetical protein PVJ39_18260, partial [Gammaproteobacteria bacterium]
MTSKNDVSGQAVKVRKNLAPDAKLKAAVKTRAHDAAPEAERLKAATQANIDAIKAVNARSRKPQSPEKRNVAKPLKARMARQNSDPPQGQRNSELRNLRAVAGATKASLKQDAVPRKTQAQLAREKLAAAAAKKARTMSAAAAQSGAAAQSRTAASAKSAAKGARPGHPGAAKVAGRTHSVKGGAGGAQQQQPATAARTGNQLIQLHPPRKAKTDGRGSSGIESRKPPIINATALLAAKYPNYFADTNDMRTKAESRAVFVITSLILSLIGFSWMNWDAINFQAEGEFTYNSGLIGGITMLCILLYALRKRVKLLRRAGPMEAWYYFHLFGGVLGPLVIVFHTGFTIKSINSGVALFTMITIVLSGLFGRYIYTRIGYSLHRKLLAIKESEKQLMDVLHSYDSPA